MKKIILGIVTIAYMFVASGFSVAQHYCMGKLAGIDLFGGKEEDKCPKCGMTEKKTGCCHDEHQFFKLKDSHKVANNEITYKNIDAVTLSVCNSFSSQIEHTLLNNVEQIAFSPPDIFQPSVYILNCNFRI